MKIVLDLDGWRKVEEVNPFQVQSGKITMSVFYPLSILIPDAEAVIREPAAVSAVFYYTGEKTSGGLPIFQYRP